MRVFKYLIIVNYLSVMMIHAQQMPMKKYENEVTDIQEIAGVSSYTLVLSCTQLNPIVVYAPYSFTESEAQDVHRYLLPNTTISEEIDNQSSIVRKDGHHVEVLLFGQLLLQTTENHKANFMVTAFR